MTSVDLDKIQLDGRFRRDMGDLEPLAASIRANGILSPVLLTPDLRLVCGERRIRAARMAGLVRIPAQISDRFEDAVSALVAERDENTCRKEMTPSELLAIGLRLEELERPKAAERQAEGREARWSPSSSAEENREPGPVDRSNWTDNAVSEALGISRSTYGRIKTVAKAAESDPDPEVRETATEALKAADAGEITVGAAATKVREARRPKKEEPVKSLAIPQPPKYGPRRKHHQVIEAMTASLTGLAIIADEIKELDGTLTHEEAARLTGDLSNSLRSLNRIKQLLKEV